MVTRRGIMACAAVLVLSLAGCSALTSSASDRVARSTAASSSGSTDELERACSAIQDAMSEGSLIAAEEYEAAKRRQQLAPGVTCPPSNSKKGPICVPLPPKTVPDQQMRDEANDKARASFLAALARLWPTVQDPDFRSVLRDASKGIDVAANLIALEGFCSTEWTMGELVPTPSSS